MNDILSDQKKFSKVSLKDDTLLNFAINQEKHVDKVLKKLVESNSTTDKTKKSLKSVGTRPVSKQIDGVAMSSPLGPTLANAFLIYHEKIGLNVVRWNIDHYNIEGTLMIYLFYLIHRNILNVFIVT